MLSDRWIPRFPNNNPWSTITYSRVSRPLITTLSPANVSDDRIVIIKTHESNSFAKIPPGESAWETRVRIVGPEASLSDSAAMSKPFPVTKSLASLNVSVPDSYIDTQTGSQLFNTVAITPEPSYISPITQLVTIVTPDQTVNIPSSEIINQNLTLNTAGIPIPSIVIKNIKQTVVSTKDEENTPVVKSQNTSSVPRCTEKPAKDMLRDLAVLCTVKRGNILDIQLHFTCDRFRTVRDTYDALSKIPNLKLIMGTQTFTEKCKCRCPPGSRGVDHQPKPSSSIHTETGPYEISIRSKNSTDLLEAGRLCKYVSDKSVHKCEFRISTNVHTYA